MAEYSKLAQGSYLSTGTPQTIYLPFIPQIVEVKNITAETAQRSAAYTNIYWQKPMAPGSASVEVIGSAGALSIANTATGGITPVYNSPGVLYTAPQQVVSMTAASNPIVTVTAHGFSNGDLVIFEGLYQSPTTGMPQICGIPFTILNVSTNTFQILWNASTSNYTALSGSPAGAVVRKIINPEQYSPGVNVIDSIGLGTQTTFVLTRVPNYVVGQTVSFRIPRQWGTVQLNPGNNPNIPGFIIYGTVISVDSGQTVVVDIDSTNFTPFTANVPVAAVPGLTFPQIVAVGDLNTGGGQPLINSLPSINGPSISGAFVNNTAQGFTIGSVICGLTSDQMFWRATYSDYTGF